MLQAGEPAELHGLAGQGEGAGDDRLAGDDGGAGREHHQRHHGPLRRQLEERIAVRGRDFPAAARSGRHSTAAEPAAPRNTRTSGSECGRYGPYRRTAPRRR